MSRIIDQIIIEGNQHKMAEIRASEGEYIAYEVAEFPEYLTWIGDEDNVKHSVPRFSIYDMRFSELGEVHQIIINCTEYWLEIRGYNLHELYAELAQKRVSYMRQLVLSPDDFAGREMFNKLQEESKPTIYSIQKVKEDEILPPMKDF